MHSWLKRMGTSLLVAGLVGCVDPDDKPGTAVFTISPTLFSIDDKGQSTELRVSAKDDTGKAGTGEVTLTVTAGSLGSAGKRVTLTLDGSGAASTPYTCVASLDAACKGNVSVDGTWGTLTRNAIVQVSATSAGPTDGGGGGGGSDGGGGGGGSDGGTDAGTPPPVTEVGKPANIVFDEGGGTAKELGIRSVGLRTATPVTFTVLDLAGVPVANATVTFSVTGPGGVSLVPATARTSAQGKASTVLQSGDEVGVAIVSGSISPETGGTLTASAPAISIVGARVSDRGFVVECKNLVLSANMTETVPHKEPVTDCTAHLSDRFANPIKAETTVNWYSEAGTIASPVRSAENSGMVTSVFSTAGKWPPAPVAPLVAPVSVTNEPFVTIDGYTYNPRDMLVTVIAVTAGEEEFYDGSGTSNGFKNSKWDKGEWFVDMPEPFIDANDNQTYDFGEAFIDTERLNCETGVVEPKNGKWDGPNGCWDGSTMIWRSTHVLYSGYNSFYPGSIEYTPAPPPSVAKGSSVDIRFRFKDSFLNIIGHQGANVVVRSFGSPGSVELIASADHSSRDRGFQIYYEQVETRPNASAPRGYDVLGPCDYQKSAPAGASTDPRLARCVWQYRFGRFETHVNSGTIRVTAGPADSPGGSLSVQTTLSDPFGAVYSVFNIGT